VTAPAIRFEDVWKSYPDWSGDARTLRGALAGATPLFRSRRGRRWALRSVSLEMAHGGSLGLVGHNGSGKSTLLRLASGLGRPSRGRIDVDADSAAVLDLGASFDPQLTGRENAFTAALVSGMTRRQARAVLPEVLEFAELEGFVDSPVRTYSEGMKLRLAFGVVATRRPAVLLLDEILAVGDLSFREKCEQRIAEMRADGTTLVLASHSLEELRLHCDRVVWLHRGSVRAEGDVETVLGEYEHAMHRAMLARTPVGAARDDRLRLGENRFGTQELRIERVDVLGPPPGGQGAAEPALTTGDPVRIRIVVEGAGAPRSAIVAVAVRRRFDDTVVMDLASGPAEFGADATSLELHVERADLPAGDYVIDVGVYPPDWAEAYDYHWGAYPLRVSGASGGKGLLAPPHRWTEVP